MDVIPALIELTKVKEGKNEQTDSPTFTIHSNPPTPGSSSSTSSSSSDKLEDKAGKAKSATLDLLPVTKATTTDFLERKSDLKSTLDFQPSLKSRSQSVAITPIVLNQKPSEKTADTFSGAFGITSFADSFLSPINPQMGVSAREPQLYHPFEVLNQFPQPVKNRRWTFVNTEAEDEARPDNSIPLYEEKMVDSEYENPSSNVSNVEFLNLGRILSFESIVEKNSLTKQNDCVKE